MTKRSFREPNFLCKVRDLDGKENEWLTYADSESSLRQRLKARNYKILELETYDFQKWKNSAAEAKQRLLAAFASGQELPYSSGIWRKLKLHLFELFDGKCAYCDSLVRDVDDGQVEHYRPRNAVHGDPDHSGYYWLAYDLDNLLPTCPRCNGSSAKGTRFPISGTRVKEADQPLDDEGPLLLHPYRDDSAHHLKFCSGLWDTERECEVYKGVVGWRTDEGETTVKTCRLNREELLDRRQSEQERFVGEVRTALFERRWRRFYGLWHEAMTGRRPHASAVLVQREFLTEMRYICPTKEEVEEYIASQPAHS